MPEEAVSPRAQPLPLPIMYSESPPFSSPGQCCSPGFYSFVSLTHPKTVLSFLIQGINTTKVFI